MSEVTCSCGQPLHYTRPDMQAIVERLIGELGPNVCVQIGIDAYMVPRHFIALHGLKAWELSDLALKYGWEKCEAR